MPLLTAVAVSFVMLQTAGERIAAGHGVGIGAHRAVDRTGRDTCGQCQTDRPRAAKPFTRNVLKSSTFI